MNMGWRPPETTSLFLSGNSLGDFILQRFDQGDRVGGIFYGPAHNHMISAVDDSLLRGGNADLVVSTGCDIGAGPDPRGHNQKIVTELLP